MDDEWDNDRPLEDWESPDENQLDEESTTTACPHCGAEMYDDTEQCPHCGEYLTSDQPALSYAPRWVYVAALIALAGMVASLFSLF